MWWVCVSQHWLAPHCDYSWHGTTAGPQRNWAESRRLGGLLLARDYSWHGTTPDPWHRSCPKVNIRLSFFQNRRDNTLSHYGRSTTTAKVLWCMTWCTPEKNQVRLVCEFTTVIVVFQCFVTRLFLLHFSMENSVYLLLIHIPSTFKTQHILYIVQCITFDNTVGSTSGNRGHVVSLHICKCKPYYGREHNFYTWQFNPTWCSSRRLSPFRLRTVTRTFHCSKPFSDIDQERLFLKSSLSFSSASPWTDPYFKDLRDTFTIVAHKPMPELLKTRYEKQEAQLKWNSKIQRVSPNVTATLEW